MKMAMKKVALAMACAGGITVSMQAEATNWLMLQGTEREAAAGRAKVWGFMQPTYSKDLSDEGGPEPTRVGPTLEKQEQFQLQRARIGVRGAGMPLDPKVNYFIMIEGGTNGATHGTGYGERTPVRLMDASVTLNHIPGARIRTGLFKTPGPEEILQGIITFDYINLTNISNQLMMERFSNGVKATCKDPILNSSGSGQDPADQTCASGDGPLFANEASWNSSFGAGRDIGLQVFDSFKFGGGLDFTYAAMVGNGNGLETGGTADGLDRYVYFSLEKSLPGGWGPKPNGVKVFVWSHGGKREIDLTDNDTADPEIYDRTRQGAGVTYRQHGIRVIAEYMKGKGVIFQGPEKPNMGIGALDANFGPGTISTMDLDGESNGYYVDLGYRFPRTNFEVDFRYDVYNRSADHDWITAEFKTKTLGLQYHFNRKTRLILNYELREAEAKDDIATAPPPLVNMTTNLHNNLGSVENRYAVQVTHIF